MTVNKTADIRPIRSPKLSKPIARPPSTTVKLSHDKKVRSLAKKTLGSTRTGRAILLPVVDSRTLLLSAINEKGEETKRNKGKKRSKEKRDEIQTHFLWVHVHTHTADCDERMSLDNTGHVLSNRRHKAAAETRTLQVEKPAPMVVPHTQHDARTHIIPLIIISLSAVSLFCWV